MTENLKGLNLNANAKAFHPKPESLSRQSSSGSNSNKPPQHDYGDGRKRESKNNKQKKTIDASEIFNFTYERPVNSDASSPSQSRKYRKQNTTFTKEQYILAKYVFITTTNDLKCRYISGSNIYY